MMWLEIYNYVTTKRKFVVKINKRCSMLNTHNIQHILEIIHCCDIQHEKINFLLISKSPYIAIKL